jgi:VIT1/CCC1 family predicted Fe2+/Mn2+ transporter
LALRQVSFLTDYGDPRKSECEDRALAMAEELGLAAEHAVGSPAQGALIIGAAFGIGAAVPIIGYLLLPAWMGVWGAGFATAGVLFGIGVLKSRWTRRPWLRSGAEILLIGALAGVAGYLFGTLLPALLGFSVPTA